jgi:hypothetical protein
MFLLPAEASNISFVQKVQTGSWAHPASNSWVLTALCPRVKLSERKGGEHKFFTTVLLPTISYNIPQFASFNKVHLRQPIMIDMKMGGFEPKRKRV